MVTSGTPSVTPPLLGRRPDYLATVDADPESATYSQVGCGPRAGWWSTFAVGSRYFWRYLCCVRGDTRRSAMAASRRTTPHNTETDLHHSRAHQHASSCVLSHAGRLHICRFSDVAVTWHHVAPACTA